MATASTAVVLLLVIGLFVVSAPSSEESIEALAAGSWGCEDDSADDFDFTMDLDPSGDVRVEGDGGVARGEWGVVDGEVRLEIEDERDGTEGRVALGRVRVGDPDRRRPRDDQPSIAVGRSFDEVTISYGDDAAIRCDRDE